MLEIAGGIILAIAFLVITPWVIGFLIFSPVLLSMTYTSIYEYYKYPGRRR